MVKICGRIWTIQSPLREERASLVTDHPGPVCIPARAEPVAQNADLAQALAATANAGHPPHLEAPERFNELVLRFLDEAE